MTELKLELDSGYCFPNSLSTHFCISFTVIASMVSFESVLVPTLMILFTPFPFFTLRFSLTVLAHLLRASCLRSGESCCLHSGEMFCLSRLAISRRDGITLELFVILKTFSILSMNELKNKVMMMKQRKGWRNGTGENF